MSAETLSRTRDDQQLRALRTAYDTLAKTLDLRTSWFRAARWWWLAVGFGAGIVAGHVARVVGGL